MEKMENTGDATRHPRIASRGLAQAPNSSTFYRCFTQNKWITSAAPPICVTDALLTDELVNKWGT